MSIYRIDGTLFKKLLINGAVNLTNNADRIDELNVFPVPDGDTGTNMKLTINSGARELEKINSSSLQEVTKKLSRGLLMGARGNSGVILSQLFRGFAMGVEGHDEVDAIILSKAFKKGVETAYKAVMKPVEGTILTVSRESADEVSRVATPDMSIEELMERLVEEAKRSLKRTPDLLPVLKEVGVVDSGGAGLLSIYEGFLKALNGEMLELNKADDKEKEKTTAQAQINIENLEFGYCTEFIVKLDDEKLKANPFTEQRLRNQLEKLGDSIVVVNDEDLVKVHVHTETPGEAMNFAQKFGEFMTIKVENMREQHSHIVNDEHAVAPAKKEKKEYGLISVCSGVGLANIFKEMGCDYVIAGGQTMNPSTEDFLKAIEEVNAKNIIIFPNNSNIVMAANQAAEVTEDSRVMVVPSKTIPQGYSALLLFNPTSSIDENVEVMKEQLADVKSGQVTYAVRDTSFNGIAIKKDDYMGILEKDIVTSEHDRLTVTKNLLDKMIDEDSEIVTIFYGDDINEDEIDIVTEYIESKYEDAEVELLEGNQPVYSYIIAVE
ncbi:DAK2 domain-containing protein [Haloplasma contractile]|uniref:Kinase hydroxyacetone kinase protein n=1 Tax=Haloplasma contractile SSD-17B TaxID=1033810 RepID=U2DYW6_9MOLU|nr:DAK2 domain-containing protein [Haloplasma contractile]ERJ13432.1 putative kinase hydroxyacetone kinase protein [Haloplasma contractile SSD-17B]